MPIDTKRIIANALEEMLRNKSIDKITVSSLIEACGISRQTFYYHFRDLMDVLEWLAQQDAQKLAERSMQAETTHEALHAFLSYAVENYALLRRLLESQRRAPRSSPSWPTWSPPTCGRWRGTGRSPCPRTPRRSRRPSASASAAWSASC